MFNEDDVRTLVVHIRSIASDCFDLRAVERLRVLADQIEQKGAAAKGGSNNRTTIARNQPMSRRFEI
jgi:hypothetical protein